jgi:3-isopropylmalate/(R)-2-methylmalate dehydratase small subunit
MQPFTVHTGCVAVLDWTDVNTDLIIPARYLKRIERTGYGPLLFADKRYEAGGAPNPDTPEKHGALAADFPLNDPKFEGCTILLVGRNFGCGSSREHAVWAVAQDGYRALIAPGKGEGYADIFENNSLNNGLLAIELDQADWEVIRDAVAADPKAAVTVDLAREAVVLGDRSFGFSIPEADRKRMLEGLDAIGETLQRDGEIAAYEKTIEPWRLAEATA